MTAYARVQVEARLLNREQAATYCGLPVRNFHKNVLIKPIRLGRHELWDRLELDKWIEALKGNGTGKTDWADAVSKF